MATDRASWNEALADRLLQVRTRILDRDPELDLRALTDFVHYLRTPSTKLQKVVMARLGRGELRDTLKFLARRKDFGTRLRIDCADLARDLAGFRIPAK